MKKQKPSLMKMQGTNNEQEDRLCPCFIIAAIYRTTGENITASRMQPDFYR
ncbi:MAG: hypothetical protein R3D71_08345 [Rickettsiales bacterium]